MFIGYDCVKHIEIIQKIKFLSVYTNMWNVCYKDAIMVPKNMIAAKIAC